MPWYTWKIQQSYHHHFVLQYVENALKINSDFIKAKYNKNIILIHGNQEFNQYQNPYAFNKKDINPNVRDSLNNIIYDYRDLNGDGLLDLALTFMGEWWTGQPGQPGSIGKWYGINTYLLFNKGPDGIPKGRFILKFKKLYVFFSSRFGGVVFLKLIGGPFYFNVSIRLIT